MKVLMTYLKNTSNLLQRMSWQERLNAFVEAEIQERVNLSINETFTIISKKHAIPMEILLRDAPQSFSITTCKGAKSNGQRCTFNGQYDGYCKHHQHQGKKIQQRNLPSLNKHTHGAEIMFSKDCPECVKSKGLIDLDSILCNE